jgi:hypothetical protein
MYLRFGKYSTDFSLFYEFAIFCLEGAKGEGVFNSFGYNKVGFKDFEVTFDQF